MININDLLDEELEQSEEEIIEQSEEETIKNVPSFSSKKLCEIVVCYRYFNINKDLSVACMEELGKRRKEGDNFLYEEYIESSLKELPELNFTAPDFRDILSGFVK